MDPICIRFFPYFLLIVCFHFFFRLCLLLFFFALYFWLMGSRPCFLKYIYKVFLLWYPRPMSFYTLGLQLGTHPMLFWTFQPNMIEQHKQLPFYYFCVYFEGFPSIWYVVMFPWKYFFSMKLERREEIKRELFYIRGGPYTDVFSWSLGTSSVSCPWVPHPQENALVKEPPLQLKPNGTISYATNNFILFSKSTTPVEVDDE